MTSRQNCEKYLCFYAFVIFFIIFAQSFDMEEITAFSEIVSNVGFPIAMCLIFCVYTMRQSERHTQEMNALKDTIQNNTTVLTELSTLIKYFVKSE